MRLFSLLVIATLSGFVSLSYEILWFRVFSFADKGRPGVFGILLGAYLLGLACGAMASQRLVSLPREADGRRQTLSVAAALGASTVAAYLVIPATAWLAGVGYWELGYLLVAIAAALLGLVFPVLSHLGMGPDEAVGARLSYLYVASIVGSAAGSLVTGFVLTDVWSTTVIARALALAGIALAGGVALMAERQRRVLDHAADRRSRARVAGSIGVPVLAAVALLLSERALFDGLYERLLFKRDPARAPFAELEETRGGVVAILQDGMVFGGGVYDGFISTDLVHDRNGLVRAYALAALHPRPARVLVIGLATGAWTEVIRNLDGVEEITAVEINEGYLPIIARHAEVSGLLHDPRVKITIDDGRRWLSRNPDARFDAIVMNTTWHWRAHSTNLLSIEFLQLARRHLLPGGILYFNSTYSPDVMKTAATVFPSMMRVGSFLAVGDAPVTFDVMRWETMLRSLKRRQGGPVFEPADAFAMRSLDSLIAFPTSLYESPRRYGIEGRASLLRAVSTARVITDDNMVPEWRGTQPLYPPDERLIRR